MEIKNGEIKEQKCGNIFTVKERKELGRKQINYIVVFYRSCVISDMAEEDSEHHLSSLGDITTWYPEFGKPALSFIYFHIY
jgi:hypothetical protein